MVARKSSVIMVAVSTVLFLCPVFLAAQSIDAPVNPSESDGSGFSFLLVPGAHLPAEGYYATGFSTQVAGMYRFGSLPLYVDTAVSFSSVASSGIQTDATVATYSGVAGGGVYWPLLPFLNVRAGARSGYASTTMTTDTGSDSMGAYYWSLLAGLDVPVFSGFSLTMQGAVAAQLVTYLSYELGIGLMWSPGAGTERTPRERPPREPKPQPLVADAPEENPESPAEQEGTSGTEVAPVEPVAAPILALTETVEYTRADLHLVDAGFSTVFPVFYRYYNDHPVGSAILKNETRRDIENVEVAVNIPRFMDLPQRQTVPETIEPGGEVMIDLSVLFNDQLLSVTEGTKVAAQIIVSYEVRGESKSYNVDTSLTVANRNAMTWDDDRKAASFVTARDPAILTFAKSVAGIVRTGGRSVVNTNLRTGMALLEALNLYGIKYVIDPTTPYSELSGNAMAIDFLQFPVQTLTYGAGDCDDLSICYTANLEAVGVPAAFITIPGHIFTAFNSGVPEDSIDSVFPRADDVIVYHGEAWIPVEITILDEGFVEAWKIGAREWREQDSRGQAQLIPIQSAWEAFEPIGLDLGQRQDIAVPAEADLLRAYIRQLDEYVAGAIEPQVARIERRIQAQGPSARQYNRLGVLYAKYEMTDQAREWLGKAIETEPSADAFLNIGHLDYMTEDYVTALRYYGQAESLEPHNDAVVLAISRVHHEMENYGLAIAYFETLETVNPDLADQFEYLRFRGSDVGRASDAALMKSVIIWGEDEE